VVKTPFKGSVAQPRPALVLTGPPAAGKSTTGRLVAQSRPRCAFIDVDDLRHLIVSGHRAPWEIEGGPEQHLLGVRNACALVLAFAASGFESVVGDMVTPETVHLYRQLKDGAVIVALRLSLEEASRRASTRVQHLTDEEFRRLYERETTADGLADVVLDVDAMDIPGQTRLIEQVWSTQPPTRERTKG
jgi:hypothetical protein